MSHNIHKKANATFISHLDEVSDSAGPGCSGHVNVLKPFSQGKINHSVSMNFNQAAQELWSDGLLVGAQIATKEELYQKLRVLTDEGEMFAVGSLRLILWTDICTRKYSKV